MTTEKTQTQVEATQKKPNWIKFSIYTVLYLAFLYWVGSWWGLIVLPFLFDAYVTRKINWSWWKQLKNKTARSVMAWVDAIVFALVAVYFLNQFFFQHFVIPSSSLEKTLLTGDYLLVSKLSYGPRIPQTPLSMPLMQHTFPILGCKSYLEHPHWDYRRVKGLGHVQVNDIVVFNYPAGDTVVANVQQQDFYRLAYQLGDQMLTQQMGLQKPFSSTLTPTTPYAEQQAVYRKIYAAGRAYIDANEPEFGEVLSRPTDRRENYVKRCVGLPGQTLQIINNRIYLDGKPNPEPENVQYSYSVTFNSLPSADEIKDLGITAEDLSSNVPQTNTYVMPLTKAVKQYLTSQKGMVAKIEPFPSATDWLFPQNMAKNWSTSNYGPIWIPKRGATKLLSLSTLPLYERCIRVYEGNTLEVRNGKIYINGRQTDRYTFKMDYYWMMGDNRDNSADSRFWGFVPEDHVVGKPLFVWLSLDQDYGWLSGKIRWNRFFKNVSNIK